MPQTHAILKSVTPLTPTILGLSFVPAKGGTFPAFLPGQYATLSFPEFQRLKGERSFSISSAASQLQQLDFGIRIGGPYTSTLRHLQPGDRAKIASPYGSFTMDLQRDQSAVMIAGGIGVTPFMSMIRTATDQQWKNDITLLYSVRSIEEAAYAEELDTLETENLHFHVLYVVADGVVPKKSNRHLAGRITPEVFSAAVEHNPFGRSYFLCGPPAFMSAMTRMMRQQGVPLGMIHSERFAVASSAIIEPRSIWPKLVFAGWGVASAVLLATVIHVEQERREIANISTNASINTTTSEVQTVPTVSTNSSIGVSPTNTNTTTTPSTSVTTSPTTPQVTTPTSTPPTYYPIQPRTRTS